MLLLKYLSTRWSVSSSPALCVQRAIHLVDVNYYQLVASITIIFRSSSLGKVKTDYCALENWRSRLNAKVKLEEFRSHSSFTLGA